ncbi:MULTISPECIES: sensor histidine kinase [Paenibacillus]|uniref:Oxygen sensor histidine kinase NreB n=1 Tax=Paenibacillus lactis 154 TaxID=743719 RepID=G4H801_9BACL|nr:MULTISPECIES: sensor histidine kinase [Paenibacillus]EHB67986.1 integral membrane sensor signal transduction histidine kinase [Paenibacillus lactis 154]GIO89715.1 sensor histidine kinase LiaS [Paenibacillus lactis]
MGFLKNTKWIIMVNFLLIGAGVAVFLYAADRTGSIHIIDNRLWFVYAAGVILFSGIAGYIAGQRIQRPLDLLHLNMLQAAKGNLTVRLPVIEDGSFSRVYDEFNGMIEALEKKVKILQRLGEQEVMEKEIAAEAAVLEERRRMARDLHDTVSQQLFAIHMSASSLPAVLKRNPEHGDQVLGQLIEMSHIAQKQMRALIAQLRPVELEGRTLEEALEKWFPDYCRQNGLKGMKDVELYGGVSEAIEHQLFLIIQEAVANIVKHAGAGLVSMSLREDQKRVVLSISDDGVGFDEIAGRQGSYGLSTMRERAEKLGGQVEIISKKGAGTTVRVNIPLFEDENGHEDSGKDQTEREVPAGAGALERGAEE